MKKTLIALMALAGVAVAAETQKSVTLGSWYTDNDDMELTLDAVVGKGQSSVSDTLSANGIGELKNVATFTIDTDDLLMTGVKLGDEVTITNIQLASNASTTWGTGAGDGRVITITLDGHTYESDQQSASGITSSTYGTLTYAFSGNNGFTFTVGDKLELTVNAEDGVVHQQLGIFKNQTGVSEITSSGLAAGWQAAVKLNCVTTVPEPTTATLSLLALAGLAARRRRRK